jgi:hypothetical protein
MMANANWPPRSERPGAHTGIDPEKNKGMVVALVVTGSWGEDRAMRRIASIT